jgi:predicted RNA-binding Zn-ribbon protein involved in translation (DUF1610 family)
MDTQIKPELKTKIISRVSNVLQQEFHGEKSRLVQGYDRLNFACPYCGDSVDNLRKKRGNVYWKSMMYHCYNCNKHTSVLYFLKDFEQGLTKHEDVSTVLDFISENKVVVASQDYLQIGVFEILAKYAIDKDTLFKAKGLRSLDPGSVGFNFVKSRFLLQRLNHFAWSDKDNQLYIFNLTKDDKVIGYQIRNFSPGRTKYVSYTMEKMHKEVFDKDLKIPGIEKINTLSLYFNIMKVDLSRNFTIFEGPTDALLYPQNSIALSGINKNSEMFDDITSARYFFDNDPIGRKTMEQKLKKKKQVFMWKKFLKENKITVPIKDFNDLIRHCYFEKNPAYKNLDKYFTTSPYDIINI